MLCAGLGTRLRPLTARWPKPALPFLGAPLLRRSFEALVQAGVRLVAVNVHHLPEVMRVVAQDEATRLGLALRVVSEEGVIQGTGGGIGGCWAALGPGPVVVLNGDVLLELDLSRVLAAHRAAGAPATMVLMPMPPGESFNAVETDEALDVRRIAGHGPGGRALRPWHFSGVHVLEDAVRGFLSGAPEDINHHVYPRLLAAGGRVHGEVVALGPGQWWDLGTPGRYLAAHAALLEASGPLGPRGQGRRVGSSWLAEDAEVHPTAELHGVSVGPGGSVGAGARLRQVAVLDGARVAADTALARAIVAGEGLVVEAG